MIKCDKKLKGERMKYRFKFYSAEEIVLPIQYNHIMQAAILNWIGDQEHSIFLHDKGYTHEKRNFKLYTFSNLYGNYQYSPANKKIRFQGEIYFWCSFYEESIDNLIQRAAEKQKPLNMLNKKLAFIDCELVEEEYEDCFVEAVSPVTIHSTVELPDGRKRTYYYEPIEREFSEMIRQNLIRKYKAVYGKFPKDKKFQIVSLQNQNYKQVSIYYKNFLIKGWRGQFLLKGSKELIKLALLAGVGARNGIGCGCILQKDIMKKK